MNEIQELDYCYKNNCSDVYANVNATRFIKTIETIRPILKSFANGFRLFMPYPFNEFDDTGAFVFVFFMVSFIFYLVSWLLSSQDKPDVLDRRALHDALTKIKEQELLLEQMRENSADKAVIDQHRKEKIEVEDKLTAMEQVIQKHERQLQEAQNEVRRLQSSIQENRNSDSVSSLWWG